MNQDGWHSLAATRQSFHSPEFWVPSWQCFRKVPQQMAGRGWGMAAGRWPVQEAVTTNPLKEQNHTRRVGMQRKSCLTVGPLQPGKDDNPALSYKLIYKIPKLKNVTLVIVKQSSKPGSCLHSIQLCRHCTQVPWCPFAASHAGCVGRFACIWGTLPSVDRDLQPNVKRLLFFHCQGAVSH